MGGAGGARMEAVGRSGGRECTGGAEISDLLLCGLHVPKPVQ